MKTSVRVVFHLCVWWHLSVLVCCQLQVLPVEFSPPEPINGGNATLECKVIGFDTSMHDFRWQNYTSGTSIDLLRDDRIEFSSVKQMGFLSIQTVTISNLQESDEGTYLCVVVDRDGTTLQNGQGDLFVNDLNEFPVCVPEGLANVREGDTLSCRTQIDARTPEVRAVGDPSGESLDWLPLNVSESISELRKNVTKADDRETFFCASIVNDTRKTLICLIGPLSVYPENPSTTQAPPSSPPLSIAAIAGIAAGGFLLLLLLLIHAICCGCNPKRWFRPKSYFLNFTGIFGTSPHQEDTHETQPELGVGLEALHQSGAHDNPTFTLDGSDQENNSTIPNIEPNIYANHTVPGTSTKFVPDPNENWNEIDLKMELSQVLDEGD